MPNHWSTLLNPFCGMQYKPGAWGSSKSDTLMHLNSLDGGFCFVFLPSPKSKNTRAQLNNQCKQLLVPTVGIYSEILTSVE